VKKEKKKKGVKANLIIRVGFKIISMQEDEGKLGFVCGVSFKSAGQAKKHTNKSGKGAFPSAVVVVASPRPHREGNGCYCTHA
jgi:hypothetical protein